VSTNYDDLDLDNIYVVVQQSNAQKLIEEKNKALFDMDRTRTPSSKKPTPAPRPKGDIRITKTYKTETISKEDNEKRKQQVEKDYNKQIKQEITKTAQDKDYDQETIKQIQDMPEKDLSVLAEKGVDGYKKFQKQQELEKTKKDVQKDNKTDFRENKNDLDITMDEKQSRDVFGSHETNPKEQPLEEKNKRPDKNIDESIKMNEKESDKTFSNSDKFQFEFEKDSKDMDRDRDKTPDPADDFE